MDGGTDLSEARVDMMIVGRVISVRHKSADQWCGLGQMHELDEYRKTQNAKHNRRNRRQI